MKTMKVNDIVTAALGIALVFLATWLLKVPNGIQGYFNLGDGFILLFASVLNPFLAFMVGGVGSALADITGGYGMYALFTLLIKGMEAVLVSWLVCRGRSSFRYVAYIPVSYTHLDVYKRQDIETTLGTYGHLYPNSNFEVARKLKGVINYQPVETVKNDNSHFGFHRKNKEINAITMQ